jgi:tetratricopeptide (TPR) repeat protein
MRAGHAAAGLAAIALGAACAGPDRGKEYVAAYAAGESAVGAGRFAEGAAHFDEAARTAKVRRDADHARYLAARALGSAGDVADAAARLRAIADASPPSEDAAEALNAVCELELARGDDAAWPCFAEVATRFPSHGVARLALRRAIAHENDAHGQEAGLALVEKLAPPLARTELAETIVYERALHLEALGRNEEALAAFVAMTKRWGYAEGSYWDDGLYRASLLAEKLGRVGDAMAFLTQMLSERTSSWIMGTYERPRYEPAMVRLCAMTRDRLHDRARARECFDRLYRELKTSELRDDALWEEARLFREDGDAASACARLGTLVHDFPDSRFVPCAIEACPAIEHPVEGGAPRTCHRYLATVRLGEAPAPAEP